MANQAKWTNPDGLEVYFNALKADNTVPASVGHGSHGRKTIEAMIDAPLVGADVEIDGRGVVIPAGSRVVSATLYVSEAFTSAGAAVLNVGLYRLDGTAEDADGLDAAVASAALSIGTVLEMDGAMVGTVTSQTVRIAVDYTTAAYTAGFGRLQVVVEDPLVETA